MYTMKKMKYTQVILLFFLLVLSLLIINVQDAHAQSGIGCCCVQQDPRTPPLSEPLQAGGSCNQEDRFRDATFCSQSCQGSFYDVSDLAAWGFDLTPPTSCQTICGGGTTPPIPVIPPGSGNCNNPVNNVITFAGQGRQKITLQWDYPDGCGVQDYEIIKTCVNPSPQCAATQATYHSGIKTFTDSNVLWDQTYRYTIQPKGGSGAPPVSQPVEASTGNIECWGKTSATPFCMSTWFYYKFFSEQYDEYMGDHSIWNPSQHQWVAYSTPPILDFIEANYVSRLNGAWSCDPAFNRLIPASPICSAGVCVVRGGNPTCAIETQCDDATADPFGLTYTTSSCEGTAQDPNYCVLDRSTTVSDQCYTCHPSMSCYDYKSQGACERNSCGSGNCAWNGIPGLELLGIGVCKNIDADNCQYCDSEGSAEATTKVGFNFVFDQCSPEKAQALSTPQQTCFHNPTTGGAYGCESATCLDFDTPERCIGSSSPGAFGTTPAQNALHVLTTPSVNQCNIPSCSWINSVGICVKNANRFIDEQVDGGIQGSNQNDCDGIADERACAADYFPPSSSIAVVDNEEGRNLQIQIIDKTSALGDALSRSEDVYTFYYCFTQNPADCDPHEYETPLPSQQYVGKTSQRLLRLVDGYVLAWNGESFEQVFSSALAAGTWNMHYYAEDPYKNVEVIHSQQINVCHDCAPPTLVDFEVVNGRKQDDIWVVESLNPTMRLTFAPQNTVLDEVVITSQEDPTQRITPTPQSVVGTPKVYEIRPSLTEQGGYLVEVTRARTVPAQSYMPPVNRTVFIDNSAPTIVNATLNGADLTITPSVNNPLHLVITFSEPVQLQTVNYRIVGKEEITDITNELERTSQTTYEMDINELPAEFYEMQIAATDLFGRTLQDQYGGLRRFSMTGAHVISLDFPEFGVSSERIFDAVFNTVHEDALECAYKFWPLGTHAVVVAYDEEDAAQEFDVLPPLQSSGARTWTGRIDLSTAPIQQGYDVSAICKYGADDFHVEHFEFMFDNIVPEIHLIPDPAVISDPRLRGNIRVETNSRIVCKYSTDDIPFSQMSTWIGARVPFFPFRLQPITIIPGLSEQTFYVECEGAAQPARLHDRDHVRFEVNLALPLSIYDQLPTAISHVPYDFSIGTTRSADCLWSVNTYPAAIPFGLAGFIHRATVQQLNIGANTFYFACQPSSGPPLVEHEKVIVYDNTPPRVSGVNDRSELGPPDDERFTALTNSLRIGWNASEEQAPVSFVSGGTYRLVDTSGQIIVQSTERAYIGDGQQFVITQDHLGNPLSLTDGKSYKFIVTAKNQLGLTSPEAQSDGVTINVTKRPAQCAPHQCGGVCGPCREGAVRCGDGIFGFGEECEAQGSTGFKLRPGTPQTCAEFDGFSGGTLKCNLNNCQYNFSSCTPNEGGTCLDSNANSLLEDCDANDVRAQTCSSLGYSGGTLKCNSLCQFDYTSCEGTVNCGNNIRESLELCDGTDFHIPGDGRLACSNFDSFTSGTLGACSASCDEVNTFGCAVCGDSIRAGTEVCDGISIPFQSCSEFFGVLGIAGASGTLGCSSTCSGFDISQCRACGNGRLEGTEQCDITTFQGSKSCSTWNPLYSSGSLQCNGQCQIVEDFCSGCGDGKISGTEICDESAPGIFKEGFEDQCSTFGLGTGTITCNSCSASYSSCSQTSTCNNNGIKDAGEVCDRTAFGSVATQCSAYGFLSGDVKCTSSCGLDFSACTTEASVSACNNNNEKEGFEECDGNDLAGKTCSTFGLVGSSLRCSNCMFDTSACMGRTASSSGTCGDGQVNSIEMCDGTLFLGGEAPACTDLGFPSGGKVKCNSQCGYDTSVCQVVQATSPICGDSKVSSGEDCEGSNLGGKTCSSLGFPGGTLSCKQNCKYNISACTPIPVAVCGDGNRDLVRFELCDGTDFGSISCSSMDTFTGGNLACTPSCTLNTTACTGGTSGVCGNGIINTGENCDGTNLGPATCKSLGFSSGILDCTSSCLFDVSACAIPGGSCTSDIDCVSGSCVNGFCAKSDDVCFDGKKNGDETGIDCGGSCSKKCDEGQLCVKNNDCSTGFCQFGVCAVACQGTDVGCGGICPQHCALNQQCIEDADCLLGLTCSEGKCTATGSNASLEFPSTDTDGDGIPDVDEARLGLDPLDPTDALEDPDEDGLTNYEEWKYGTDLFNADTDGDGWSDKEEIDAGTDPLDPDSHPSSGWITFFIILLLLIIVGVGSYYGWQYYERNKKQDGIDGISGGIGKPFLEEEKSSSGLENIELPPAPKKVSAIDTLKGITSKNVEQENKEWVGLGNLNKEKTVEPKKVELQSKTFQKLQELRKGTLKPIQQKALHKEIKNVVEEKGEKGLQDKEKVFKALTQLKQGTLPKKDQPAAFDKLKSLTGNKPKKQEIVKKIPNKDAFEKLKGLKNKKIVTKRK